MFLLFSCYCFLQLTLVLLIMEIIVDDVVLCEVGLLFMSRDTLFIRLCCCFFMDVLDVADDD